MDLSEYHAKFPGGVRWRVTPDGVEVEGNGPLSYNAPMFEATAAFLDQNRERIANASKESGVPIELLIACAMTQSQGNPGRKFVWRDPGYFGDSSTPNLISAGVCRMLVSTARYFMKDPGIDHHWLADTGNALRAAAAYIAVNHKSVRTAWDPILVACAFNAGGLYEDKSPGNQWRLRQHSMLLGFHGIAGAQTPDPNYADQFARYFAAARVLAGREYAGF